MGKRSIESFVDEVVNRWKLSDDYEPKGNLVSSYHLMAIKSQDSADPNIWDVKTDSDLIQQIAKLPNQQEWALLLARHGILYDPDRKHFLKVYSLDDSSNNKVLSTSFISFRKTWVSVLNDEYGWINFLKFKKNIGTVQLMPFKEPSPYLPLVLGFICCECGSGFTRFFASDDKPNFSSLTQHYEKVHTSLPASDRIYLVGYIQQSNSNGFQAVKIGKSQLIELQTMEPKAERIYSKLIFNSFMQRYNAGVTGADYQNVLYELQKLVYGLIDNLSITNIIIPVVKKCLNFMEGKGTHEDIYEAVDKAKNEYKNFKSDDKLFNLLKLDLTDALASYLGYLLQCYGYQKSMHLQDKFTLAEKSDTVFECSFGNIKVKDYNIWILFLIKIICPELNTFPINWPSWKSREFRVLQSVKVLLTDGEVALKRDFLTIEKLKDVVYEGPPVSTVFTDEKLLSSSTRSIRLPRERPNDSVHSISESKIQTPIPFKEPEIIQNRSQENVSTHLKSMIAKDVVFENLLKNFKKFLNNEVKLWTPELYLALLNDVKNIVLYCTEKAVGRNVLKDIEPLGLDPGNHYELAKFDCKIDPYFSKYAAHFFYLLLVLQDQSITSNKCKSVDVFPEWNFVFDNGVETADKDISIAATILLVGWGVEGCFLSTHEAKMVGYISASKISNFS